MTLRNKAYAQDATLIATDTERFDDGLRNILTVFGETAFVRSVGIRSAPGRCTVCGVV